MAATKLADVERRIKRRMTAAGRDLAAEAAADADFKADVIEVEAEAVARVLRNPDGLKSEGIDDYQKSRDKSLSDGQLRITAKEWGQLGLRPPGASGKAFAIDQTPDVAVNPRRYDSEAWSVQ